MCIYIYILLIIYGSKFHNMIKKQKRQSPFSEQRCLEEAFSFLPAWEAQNCPGVCMLLVAETLKPGYFITQPVVQLTGLLAVFFVLVNPAQSL